MNMLLLAITSDLNLKDLPKRLSNINSLLIGSKIRQLNALKDWNLYSSRLTHLQVKQLLQSML